MHAGTGALQLIASPLGWMNPWSFDRLLPFLIVGGLVVGMIVLRLLDARAKRRELAPSPARAAQAPPSLQLDELERRAGLALVASDDRVTAAAAEVDYAGALDGDEVATVLRSAHAKAREQLAEAFAVQRDAGLTSAPDAERRAAYERILRLTDAVDAALDRDARSLEQLRALGARAGEERDALLGELAAVERDAAGSTARLADAAGRYAAEALDPAATALDDARAALGDVRARLSSPAVAAPGTAAAVHLTSARAELRDAADRVAAAEADLAALTASDLAVADAIAALERDIEVARAMDSARLGSVADDFTIEAAALREALAAAGRDPVSLGRRVVRADAAIDAEIRAGASAGALSQRVLAERSSSLASARMLVGTAEHALAAEPADAAARIRRDEALALLAEARDLLSAAARPDLAPGDARERADAAAHLARRSLAIARDDAAGTPASGGRLFDRAAGGDGFFADLVAGLLERADERDAAARGD
ncbi:hypothetical protein JOE59_001867 [Agromyces cerinus]|uniref:hypothetical protein n=1 Tax=Agromyces cerinus TaxID=33878 RepID=UPI00195C1D6D|nr:hypothetical protein [Agromyces cerinus]MBM7831162.1 hypothetical protein [Agromyces cerinus]